MTMLAKTTETRALTLADYEARIHLYKEQGALAYIGIGRTLTEAKEAGVVPHGQWETWVQEVAGFTPRQAQRCMQMAEKVPEGSALAKLDASKALLLISSGLDAEEQEAIAEKAADEGATVKALREEVRQAKMKLVQETGVATEMRLQLEQVQRERDDLAGQIKAQIGAFQKRMDGETEKAYRAGLKEGQENSAGIAAKELAKKDEEVRELERAQYSLQNELNKQTQYAADLRKKLEEGPEVPADFAKDREILIAAAEEAEKRAAEAEAQLEALKAGGAGQPDPIWKTLKLATDRFMTDCETMPLDPAALISDQRRIRANVNWIGSWVDMMRKALDAAVPAEGAVE